MTTETTHTRSRRVSLGGLFLQLATFAGTLALSFWTHSQALFHLSWYVLGGVPIWFVTLLVFRQRELAALEAMDLEALRREKAESGGGEAIFGEEGGMGLAFRVAEARLRWMQRWLIPTFGLATAVYLCVMGLVLWQRLGNAGLSLGSEGWGTLASVPMALVILAILMILTFLLSRYTSGMGRVPEWQLLRGCGAYMLGNALMITLLMIALGVWQYTQVATWEQALAYAVGAVMVVLAGEIGINYVLDLYRPRTPGAEPRACFDSRLLGLIAEPGGIAHSIAEALNYQFGFKVSQTWFYQLLARAFLWLLAAGALSLWAMTCTTVVQPYEHVIIERWGKQQNAAVPLGPGLHFKWPWPMEVARPYNTGQLHQISIGFQEYDATPKYDESRRPVLLWTDERHLGLKHFDFLVCRPPREDEGDVPAEVVRPETPGAEGKAYPVNSIRMEVTVQYRICADELALYTQTMRDPERTLRDMAWQELGRFNASSTPVYLLGKDLAQISAILQERITKRVREFGLEVVYVGVTTVHPEKTVAQADREIIGAERQKVTAIREAQVMESQRLSAVAGDSERARRLAQTTVRVRESNERLNGALRALREVQPETVTALSDRLMAAATLIEAHTQSVADLEDAAATWRQVEEDYELGLGQTFGAPERARDVVRMAEGAEREAAARVEEAFAPVRAEAAGQLTPEQVDALVASVTARVAGAYWDRLLDDEFRDPELGGEAAARLSQARAERWTIEMGAAVELARAENEREAYQAAPEVYKARRLMEVLTDGVRDARKYFLAFDPGDRLVRVRFVAEDTLGSMTDVGQVSKKENP